MMTKHQGVHPFLAKLGESKPLSKRLSMTHHADLTFDRSSEKDVPFMLQGANAFVKDHQKRSSFHANSFYRHGSTLPNKL